MSARPWIVFALIAIGGCDEPAPQQPLAPIPPIASPPPNNAPSSAPIPASQATGVWNQQQVEGWLRETLKLSQVSLTAAGNSNYSGTGTGADGNRYQLNIKQVPGGIACRYTFGSGGNGRIAFGNPVSD
jgi:hypothetical protein